MAQYDYDVIIAGGGMSGLLTASAVGYFSKQNAKVLVVDRNSVAEPGKKTNSGWICGDAASKKSIAFIEKNIGIKYDSPELEHPVKGIYVYSPNHETKVLFEGEGYILNRKLMPKRQVKDAKGFGVEFKFGTTAEKLVTEDGYVRGVAGRDSEGKPFKATAKMVVDASGSSSVLRKFLPIQSYIDREIEMDDMEATGRYLLEFDQGVEDETYFTPEYCLIHLDQNMAPAGYCVAPGTPIVCKNSLKAVEAVKLGDEILTSEGWMPVSGTSERNFTGELVVITPYMLNQPVSVTPEHLIRVWNPRTGETWKRADELMRGTRGKHRNGDYLVMPLPSRLSSPLTQLESSKYLDGIVEGDYLYLATKRSFFDGRAPDGSHRRKIKLAKHPRHVRVPLRLLPDETFMELCGWYLSEGSIKKHHVTISNTDRKTVSRISSRVERLGQRYNIWKSQKEGRKTCYNIEITNSLWADLMVAWFGKGARNKKLPSWIHDISRDSKIGFLKGVYHGDGSIEHDNRGNRSDARSLTTAAHAVAVDLWMLLTGMRLVASIKRNKKKNAWAVVLFGHQAGFLGEALKKAPHDRPSGYVLGDGRIYLGIRRLSRQDYSGPVYDLNSGGDFTPMFNVHNCWVFPKGKNKVNIGLGVSKPGLDRRNKRLGKNDNLQTLIDQYVRDNPSIKNWRLSTNPDDKGNEKGNWQVPVRRQNDCMVANGFAVVGDAAWMPRPLDAGGMGPAMYASMILGKVVARAIEAGDVSQEGLWTYNSEYMQTHGYQMASFEVLRRYLQTVTNEQIDFGMKHFLTQEDIDAITERRHPRFNAVNKLNPKLLMRAAQQMELAKGLRYTADISESLVNHNLKYPTTPKGFPEWKKQIVKLIDETKTRFNPAAA